MKKIEFINLVEKNTKYKVTTINKNIFRVHSETDDLCIIVDKTIIFNSSSILDLSTKDDIKVLDYIMKYTQTASFLR